MFLGTFNEKGNPTYTHADKKQLSFGRTFSEALFKEWTVAPSFGKPTEIQRIFDS
jgi:hypothetical protein